MNRVAFQWAIVACVAFTFARAEELPNQRGAKTDTAISVRPLKRLFFEDNLNSVPAIGARPATFAFVRSGETNNPLTVYFILTGTAELEADYSRIVLGEEEGSAITNGEVQSVSFAPGQRIQFAHFKIIVDAVRERAEYIRVIIPEPVQNGIFPPQYHLGARTCATIWITNLKRCDRLVPAPGGGVACVGPRPVLPAAWFRAPRCVQKPPPFPGVQ